MPEQVDEASAKEGKYRSGELPKPRFALSDPLCPLLISIRDAAYFLGVGTTTVYKLIRSGILHARKIGRATRVTTASVLKEAGYKK